jgi:hypothetical protein
MILYPPLILLSLSRSYDYVSLIGISSSFFFQFSPTVTTERTLLCTFDNKYSICRNAYGYGVIPTSSYSQHRERLFFAETQGTQIVLRAIFIFFRLKFLRRSRFCVFLC